MDRLNSVLDYLIMIVVSCLVLSGIAWVDHTLGWHNPKYSPPKIAKFIKQECSPWIGDLVIYLYPKNERVINEVR